MKSTNLSPDSTQQRMLLSFAHPDDESFGMGGAIAYYARRGADVYLICSTNGDVGTVAPERMNGYQTIGELRLAELECAASTLGITEVIPFGYRDSGMMGAPENDHPDALWQADRDTVTARIVREMRRIRPQVVVTFDPYGGYGHPDHIYMHKVTSRAFHAAGDPAQYPEQIAEGLQPWQPQKLYYSAFPRMPLRLMVLAARLRGQDPRRLGVNADLDLQAALEQLLPVTTRISVAPYQRVWDAAAQCHASQSNPRGSAGFFDVVRRLISRRQEFTRAWPEPRPGEPVERDLFQGVS